MNIEKGNENEKGPLGEPDRQHAKTNRVSLAVCGTSIAAMVAIAGTAFLKAHNEEERCKQNEARVTAVQKRAAEKGEPDEVANCVKLMSGKLAGPLTAFQNVEATVGSTRCKASVTINVNPTKEDQE